MSTLHPHTRTIFRRASTAAVCAVMLWCGSRAEASCGDYVMVGGRHDPHAAATGRFDSDAPAVPRCRGPLCSDNSIPPAAPAPKMHMAVERWAIAAGARQVILPARDSLRAEPQQLPCDGFGMS